VVQFLSITISKSQQRRKPQRVEARKKTMKLYFQSLQIAHVVQPLSPLGESYRATMAALVQIPNTHLHKDN